MISLYVIQGNDQGRRFELLDTTASIGRDPGNNVHLRDAEVSRRHAHIDHENGEFRLVDDESANGVFVNGKRAKNHVLKNGDQFLLGKTLLLFANRPPTESDRKESQHPDRITVPVSEPMDEDHVIVQTVPSGQVLHSQLFAGSKNWNPQVDAHLKMMYHTTLVTSQTLDIGVLLHRILDLIFEWVRIDRGCIMFFDPESNQLVPQVTKLSQKKGDSVRHSRFSINKAIISYVLKRREGVLTNDAQEDSRWTGQERGAREAICVPMLGRYGLVGVIYIDTFNPSETPSGEHRTPPAPGTSSSQYPRLTSDHLRLMVAIAHQAALAVEDTRYYMEMVHGERLAAIGQTVSVLSHHVKNILQGISGGSHLIRTGLERHEEEMIRKGWGIVERNQNRISRLVLDMLTFSKEREPAYELVDIADTIRDIVESLQSWADEMGVELRFEQEENLPKFYFDPEQIHRALLNVVSNGIDAVRSRDEKKDDDLEDIILKSETVVSMQVLSNTERKGLVRIKAEFDRDRSLIRVTVDDNGPGIPSSCWPNMFKPFYSEKKGRGTGLGLPVLHKIVSEHGGTVRVADSDLGGARFQIELPFKLDVVPAE